MNVPQDLNYTKNDEWFRLEGEIGTLGITDYAQDQLSDIVYFEVVVSPGDSVSQGDAVATVESVKAASDIYSAASGEIVEINEPLADTPELLNTDPYSEAWVVKIKVSDPAQLDALMSPEDYLAYIEERES